MSDLYDPKSHDYQGTSSIGTHRSCVLCGSSEELHLSDYENMRRLRFQLAEKDKRIDSLTSERTKLYSVLKDLHETTCPYKPFATIPHYEEPENIPICTCSNQKKTRYWAVQDFLHRGEITILSELIDELADILNHCKSLNFVLSSSLREIVTLWTENITRAKNGTESIGQEIEKNSESVGDLNQESDTKNLNLQESIIQEKQKLERHLVKLFSMEKLRNQINVSDATSNLNYDLYMATTTIIQSLMTLNGYALSVTDLFIENSSKTKYHSYKQSVSNCHQVKDEGKEGK